MIGLRHCGERMRVVDTRQQAHHTRRRRECLVCHQRITTYEVVYTDEEVAQLTAQRISESKPPRQPRPAPVYIRYCKDCKTQLTEDNLLKKRDQICISCKAARQVKPPRQPKPAPNRKLPDVTILIELYHRPMSLVGIGKLYNVNAEAVRQLLLKAGVTMRRRGYSINHQPRPPKPPWQPRPIGCPDCVTKCYSRGLCRNCYERARRRGELARYAASVQAGG